MLISCACLLNSGRLLQANFYELLKVFSSCRWEKRKWIQTCISCLCHKRRFVALRVLKSRARNITAATSSHPQCHNGYSACLACCIQVIKTEGHLKKLFAVLNEIKNSNFEYNIFSFVNISDVPGQYRMWRIPGQSIPKLSETNFQAVYIHTQSNKSSKAFSFHMLEFFQLWCFRSITNESINCNTFCLLLVWFFRLKKLQPCVIFMLLLQTVFCPELDVVC